MADICEHIAPDWQASNTEVPVASTPESFLKNGIEGLLQQYMSIKDIENSNLRNENLRLKNEIAELKGKLDWAMSIIANKGFVQTRPAQSNSFRQLIQHDNPELVLHKLHERIDGKGGKAVAVVLRRAYYEEHLISALPTESQFVTEFELHGRWRSISHYLRLDDNNTKEATENVRIME